MALWAWAAAKFGLAKLIGGLVLAGVIASFVTGVYVKGYTSCASAYQLAAKDALIADLMKDLKDQADAMEFGTLLADVMNKAETANDQTSPSIVGNVTDSTPVIDAGFVQRLGKLR